MPNSNTLQKFSSLPVSTAILDNNGVIVGVNKAWKAFGKQNGLCIPNFGVGENYFDYCQSGKGKAGALAKELKALLSGARDLVTTVYPCHSPSQQRWFVLIGLPLSRERPGGIAVIHADLTKLLPTGSIAQSLLTSNGNAGTASAMANSIEKSVSSTLGSQLRDMLEIPKATASPSDSSKDIRTKLSKKQIAVLKLLGQGKSNDEIAKALYRSTHTIKLHVSAILRELNVKSRTQAAILASKLLADGE
jgi:DNA-binding CsgD family transcriptional regulator